MITYFDTSVVMGLFDPNQVIYENVTKIFLAAQKQGTVVTTTLHTYSELYNNLSKKGGGRPGLLPKDVAELLVQRFGKIFTLVELASVDYESAVIRCGQLNIPGPVIYDALHYQAALKAGADVLYTDNLKDFTRLQLPDDQLEVKGVR
ncbi:MAG: PIN domain-containing protein [Bacteroidota bacterium]